MRADIVPGGVFPDYALPDHTGAVRTLLEVAAHDPLVLILARGSWCPQDRQQHRDVAAAWPRFEIGCTQVVTLTTDGPEALAAFRASVGASWTFLSDQDRRVQQELGIQEYTDPEHDALIPHTLVLRPALEIYRVYVGAWFWGRPSPHDLWRDLRAVTSESRPDWDPTTPGLREAWEAGDRSFFRQPEAGRRPPG